MYCSGFIVQLERARSDSIVPPGGLERRRIKCESMFKDKQAGNELISGNRFFNEADVPFFQAAWKHTPGLTHTHHVTP